jgi:hypothetical protein
MDCLCIRRPTRKQPESEVLPEGQHCEERKNRGRDREKQRKSKTEKKDRSCMWCYWCTFDNQLQLFLLEAFLFIRLLVNWHINFCIYI